MLVFYATTLISLRHTELLVEVPGHTTTTGWLVLSVWLVLWEHCN